MTTNMQHDKAPMSAVPCTGPLSAIQDKGTATGTEHPASLNDLGKRRKERKRVRERQRRALLNDQFERIRHLVSAVLQLGERYRPTKVQLLSQCLQLFERWSGQNYADRSEVGVDWPQTSLVSRNPGMAAENRYSLRGVLVVVVCPTQSSSVASQSWTKQICSGTKRAPRRRVIKTKSR